eukprot:3046826-Prymnesium_polylepis.2
MQTNIIHTWTAKPWPMRYLKHTDGTRGHARRGLHEKLCRQSQLSDSHLACVCEALRPASAFLTL